MSSEGDETSGIEFQGGDGRSIEDAVIILNARSTMEGIDAEMKFIASIHGEHGRDWLKRHQSLLENEGKEFDAIDIELRDGTELTYFFNISDFFGKSLF